MKWTEEVDRRIEWINKRTPLTDLQIGYIEFQMFELLKLHEKVIKNNVGLANVVSMLKCCNTDCDEPVASPDGVYCEFHRSM